MLSKKLSLSLPNSNKDRSGNSSPSLPNSYANKEGRTLSLNRITSLFRLRGSAATALEAVEEQNFEEYPPHNFPTFTTVQLNGEFPVSAVEIKLHTAALISKSKFFADRLEHNFEKSKSYYDESKNSHDERRTHHDVINLNNIRLDIFKLFVQFVENGRLTDADLRILDDPRLTSEETDESAVCKGKFAFGGKTHLGAGPDIAIDRLINAYLLGERLQAPYFCNIMLEGLAGKYRDFFREHDSQVPLWNLEHAFSGRTYFGMQRFVADAVHFALSKRTLDFAFQKGLLDEGIREKIRSASLRNGVEELPPWENVPRYYEHPHSLQNLQIF